ncbi:DNA-binding protein WhiA [Pasteuria penetrans]|uniref:DNA-binding protein WhiA n=1 Tax=Pasteuria penetrans TaxID=86005 RepID=UPI000FC00841|nr:DNA-binding protein WhiA [Pasteuria penetrans]
MSSFSSSIKREIVQSIGGRACCQRALLSALVKMNGDIVSEGGSTLRISTENAAVARYLFRSFKDRYGVAPEVVVRRRMRLRKNRIYQLQWKQNVEHVLRDLALCGRGTSLQFGGGVSVVRGLVKKGCCCRAHIRGAFLAGGSVSDPEKGSYHLEIIVSGSQYSRFLCELMVRLHLHPKQIRRKNARVVYLKEGEKIGTFLRLVGAHPSLLTFENVRILKGVRNSVNRTVNCETANLNRTVRAAMRQIDSIGRLDQMIGLEKLPVHLREVAELRREHPELSLEEIGKLLPSGQVSKSSVNYRLRRLEGMASQL